MLEREKERGGVSESERDKFRIKEPFGGKNMLDRDSKEEGERERKSIYLCPIECMLLTS